VLMAAVMLVLTVYAWRAERLARGMGR
ncbi:hypothetical protein ACV34H_34725, partial [Pseudomonas aeruginosa]